VRLIADENFNGDVIRGMLLRRPDLDIVRVQDVGLAGASDPAILEWAAANDRIILSHDRSTLPDFAYERVAIGEEMPGVFILDERFPVGQALQELLLITECSEHSEWSNLVIYVPL
jgi:predicted nuclease of predicted toxin-antitoxin system